MPKNILKNPDFENDDVFLDPWQCTGVSQCGVNTPAKDKVAEHANNFGYMVGEWNLGQNTDAKQGETYNLSYYAYAWDYIDTQRLSGWNVRFGQDQSTNDNLTTLFGPQNVQPPDWPFWTHIVNSTSGNEALTFQSQNNTVFFIDNVSLECLTCKSKDHTGAIVGGVIGGLAGLAALVLGIAYYYLRIRKPNHRAGSSAFLSPAGKKKAGSSKHGGGDGSLVGISKGDGGEGKELYDASYAIQPNDHPNENPPSFYAGSYTNPGSTSPRSNHFSGPSYPTQSHSRPNGADSSNGGEFGGFPEIHAQQDGDLTKPDIYPAFHPGGGSGHLSTES